MIPIEKIYETMRSMDSMRLEASVQPVLRDDLRLSPDDHHYIHQEPAISFNHQNESKSNFENTYQLESASMVFCVVLEPT